MGLVLNATAAITNLLFYDVPSSLLHTSETKQLLCRLLRPLLLASYNVEALAEASRALGNLTRCPDARRCIGELRIDEILCILLAHDDRDLVFYACGALVNLSADPHGRDRLLSIGTADGSDGGVLAALSSLLLDADAGEEDAELALVAVKVLANLTPGIASWSTNQQ